MKNPKLILCLALVLSGGMFGCATKYRLHSSNWNPTPFDRLNRFPRHGNGGLRSKPAFPPFSEVFTFSEIVSQSWEMVSQCREVVGRHLAAVGRHLPVVPRCLEIVPRCRAVTGRHLGIASRHLVFIPRCIEMTPFSNIISFGPVPTV